MAAIIGLSSNAVAALCSKAAESDICEMANDNGGDQIVISGTRAAVDRAVALAPELGAKRAILLQVSAPFHCRLMQPAAERMREALADAAISAPIVPVVSNVTATATSNPAEIRRRLVRSGDGPGALARDGRLSVRQRGRYAARGGKRQGSLWVSPVGSIGAWPRGRSGSLTTSPPI